MPSSDSVSHCSVPSLDGEGAPFLPAVNEECPELLGSDRPFPKYSNHGLIIKLFAIYLAIGMGGPMIQSPLTRIVESIACQNYWNAHDRSQVPTPGQISEAMCKIPEVQKEVTSIIGYREFFNALLTSTFALPYGLLADRCGRKLAIRLASVGFLFNSAFSLAPLCLPSIFPLRMIWFGAIGWVLGGGPVLLFALLWSMIADATADSEQDTVILRFGTATLSAGFLAQVASSFLMQLGSRVPLMIGCGLLLAGLLVANLLPETLRKKSRETTISADTSISPAYLVLKIKKTISSYRFICDNYPVAIIMPAFFITQLSGGSAFLVQYISIRFHRTIADATLLVALQQAFTIAVLFFIIPQIAKGLLEITSRLQSDLHLARISVSLLALGLFGIGLSSSINTLIPSLILHAAGAGFALIARGLVTGLARKEETARLYTLIEVTLSIGEVAASLYITNSLNWGLERGGLWTGLPWLIVAFLLAVIALVLGMLRLPPRSEDFPSGSTH
ncbi:MFS general substrate transporter [Aspergillus pseudotamarii]|uniref:MFS general substrate transporter n=1 Tax=Aspergillus pseudotamarii TaxID=132259 RepID=A0A5N6TBW0_ASPPS|nr:MFS general substrate transporter [Aspergillus pseudotamarii]KAE8143864.1 MFS general substrate transporter [Aspergillus pseudotamarii]